MPYLWDFTNLLPYYPTHFHLQFSPRIRRLNVYANSSFPRQKLATTNEKPMLYVNFAQKQATYAKSTSGLSIFGDYYNTHCKNGNFDCIILPTTFFSARKAQLSAQYGVLAPQER